MSLPPELIRVKRKATEIEPVSYLRFQEHKRHVTDAFVYQRQKQDAAFADIPTPSRQRPIIHTSTSQHDAATFQSAKNNKERGGHGDTSKAASGADAVGTSAEQRQFHMSRADIMLASSNYPTHRSYRGISKKRSAPALFVERKHKRLPSTKFSSISHGLDSRVPEGTHDVPLAPIQQAHAEDMEVDNSAAAETKPRKKPGLAKQAQKDGTARKTELPPSVMNRWNVNVDQLTADMNAFAMEQIGLNLMRQEEEEKKRKERAQAAAQRARMVSSSSPARFKPKAPAMRYAERHPEESDKIADNVEANDDAASGTDEEEYIIETYVRVPASAMEQQHVAPKDVGLLVFDEEPDMEYFYGANDDSDDEWVEDEDDENAENHYTADYPDDEVASDDEFGQNAYAYRNNASDNEEYDVDGYQDSSPDDSDVKGGFKSFVSHDGTVRRHL